ncbi:hypothetical protein HX819_01100 [Pseudomonas sp. D6002]|uniref:hypothetical protein n=1 Tax=unclassified Pseudomonas TaxID=196821 RepID=UPI0015A2CC92|nr:MULTISPECIES: hypothetical protein [unclassified Pseudomonas]NVZ94158.1 hypothetical protein [Pseudomonas sp. B6001]NWB12987.1 hypothetical protein [Pseudomonas sp. D6002]
MNEVVFVPEGELLTLVCPVEGDDSMGVRMEFLDDFVDENHSENKAPDSSFLVDYEVAGEDSHIECVVLKFLNFGGGFGQSLIRPINIADSEDRRSIFFFASVQKLGKVRRIEFQFTIEQAGV